jgi:molybdopterin converting factor small subunit
MKHIHLVLFAAFTLPCLAEEKPIDLSERAESISILEQHISQREKRLAEWGREIIALDGRIETQVDDLVKLIAGMKDSNDSRGKVNQLKKDAINGLKRGIEVYATKRRDVAGQIRAGDRSSLGDLDVLDDRILKRIDQIATITKSIPTHQDVEKYVSDGVSYWDGYYTENVRISDEWKVNRRDTSAAKVQRRDTMETLKADLEKLDQRRRELEDTVKNRKPAPAALELYKRDLGKIDAYQDFLNRMLREVTTATDGGGEAVGMEQAIDIIHMVEDARGDLREDVSTLFRNYDRFAKGRKYLDSLKANLEARKKWMEANAPASEEKK